MAISSPPRGAGQAVPDRQRTLVSALILALVAVLVLATIVVALLARGGSSTSGVQGSGVAATQSRVLPRFSRLDLAGSTNVTVIARGQQSVVVRADSNLIRYSEAFPDANALLAECARLGLEGIVAKRRDAPYRSGTRSGWIKVKTSEWKVANQWRAKVFEKPTRG